VVGRRGAGKREGARAEAVAVGGEAGWGGGMVVWMPVRVRVVGLGVWSWAVLYALQMPSH
jgi:hypothetical protein